MSSSTYFSYYISPEEQKKLERERQKREEEERKRKVEEKKREEKRRRLKAISEERERVSISNQFREKILKIQKGNVLVRLKKIKKLIEEQKLDLKEKSKLIDNIIKLETAINSINTYKELQQYFLKIKEFEQKIVKKNQSKNTYEITKQKMEDIIISINSQLENLPDDYWLICSRELQRIKQTISDIERERTNNFIYFYQTLKALQQDFWQLLEAMELKRKTWYEDLEKQYSLMDEIILELEIVHEMSIVEEQRKLARTIITAIESLKSQKDLTVIELNFADLQRQAELLIDEFKNITRRYYERNFIFNTLQDTLKEMGYKVIVFSDTPKSKPSAPKITYFKTPSHEIIKIEFGLDNSIHTEFAHMVRDTISIKEQFSRNTLISKCQNWCNDYSELLQRLRRQGFEIREKWRIPPEKGKFEKIVAPRDRIDVVSEEKERLRLSVKGHPKKISL